MANPTVVSCTKKTWAKVVDNKTIGSINLKGGRKTKSMAYYLYNDTGEAAPTANPSLVTSTAIEMESQYLPFNSAVAIDIYIWALSGGVTAVVAAE